ncbi:cytochrome P450 [Lactifluus volemus]|nr:cytochrome P450 [Lactifluus volemus]
MLFTRVSCFCFLLPFIFRRNIRDKEGHRIPPGPLLRYAFLRRYPERLFVVISDARIAKDLLVSNGAIFSSRKPYFMKNETILRGRGITATPYNDKWRQHRRIAMQLLTPKAIQGYSSVLDYEAHILVRSLYHKSKMGTLPVNPAHSAGRYTLNSMLTISFATRTDSTLDPLTEQALDLATVFMDLSGPWSNIIDFIEPLQWIPTIMRSRARHLHDKIVEVYGAMIMRVKARIDAGDDVPDCLVKTLLLTQEQEKLSWEDLCMLSVVFTIGGTSSVILWFLALMSSRPEVQARAHSELDTVIGRDYWPTAEDEQSLPYIRAVIKERAHSPFWMGVPHYSTEDFVYNGMYYIPKNTTVILNCFDIHHNEEKYPTRANPFLTGPSHPHEPRHFKLPNAMDRDHWAFGAGRRICPGIHVAERELWLAISRLLWAFDIRSLPMNPFPWRNIRATLRTHRCPTVHVQTLLDAEQEVTLMTL